MWPKSREFKSCEMSDVSGSCWDAACGLGVIYYHYVPTLELAFTDALCESQSTKE